MNNQPPFPPDNAVVRHGGAHSPAAWQPGPELPPGPAGETDDIQALAQYLRILWRRKWTIALSVAGGFLLALGISLFTTPLYQARTNLEIQDFQEPLQTALIGGDSNLETQAELLRSLTLRNRALAVIDEMPVPELPDVREPLSWLRRVLGLRAPEASVSWDEAVERAAFRFEVESPERGSAIVVMETDSPNPIAAAQFVDTLAQQYILSAQEDRWEEYQEAGEWLTQAAEEQKRKLEESQQALADFARAEGLIVAGGTNLTESNLTQIQEQLAEAAAERIMAEANYEASQSSPTAALPEVLDSGPMATYQVQIADLKRELALLSTTLTPAHFRVREIQNQIDQLEQTRDSERENIIRRYEIVYEAANRREQQLRRDFQQQSRLFSGQSETLIQYNVLLREVETNSVLYETTLARGKEASVQAAMRPTGARVVDPARVPLRPYWPNLPLNLALGVVGSLIGASAVVIVRTGSDTRIQIPGALSPYLQVRELGVIPAAKTDPEVKALARRADRPQNGSDHSILGGSSSGKDGELNTSVESLGLVSWTRKPSVFAEAFRATMTSILYSGENGDRPKVLLVSSPSPQEGKSTVVSNLAIALAEINMRVLLVDGDLRRPRLHTIFDVPNTFGLSDVLHERTPIEDYSDDALSRKTRIPGLEVLPSGPARASVTRLLYSPRMRDLTDRLRNTFDIVLIDGAPVLSVPDSRVIARVADAVVLVVRAHKTSQESVFAAAGQFTEDGTRILGTILNDWNPNAAGQAYYGAYYDSYRSPYHEV